MPSVTFIQLDRESITLDVKPGQSLMEASVQAGLPGIAGDCGGSCSCATCHVYVGEPWYSRLEPATGTESDVLEFLDNYRPNSRLACQLFMTDELDGLVVETPRAGAA